MNERFFQILAVVLIGIAAFFLWRGNNDGAVAAAVVGCVVFFLNIRFGAKRRVDVRNAEIVEKKYGGELPDISTDPVSIEEQNIPDSHQDGGQRHQKPNAS